MSITRINKFQAAAGKSEELYTFLQSLVPYISSSEGCGSCTVLRNTDSRDKFAVIEQWTSITAHQQSIAAFPKEQMQAAMGLFGSAPEGEYYHA